MDTQKNEPARRNGDIDSRSQTDDVQSAAAAAREEVVDILSGAIATLVITGRYRRTVAHQASAMHNGEHGDAR